MFVGRHISIAKGLQKALEKMEQLEGNTIQVFFKSPRRISQKSKITLEDINFTTRYIKKYNIKFYCHCSYMINLSRQFSDTVLVDNVIEDMNIMSKINGHGCVVHMGKQLKMSREHAIENMVSNIKYILKHTPKNSILLLENSAHQGTEIGYDMEEIQEILEKINNKRVRVCIDTCHAWVAGHSLKKLYSDIKKTFGWKRVDLVHLNDSKNPKGAMNDNHENLGSGTITQLDWFIKKMNKPMILETPVGKGNLLEIQHVKKIIN